MQRPRRFQKLPDSLKDVRIIYYVDGSFFENQEEGSRSGSAAIMFIWSETMKDWVIAKKISSCQ